MWKMRRTSLRRHRAHFRSSSIIVNSVHRSLAPFYGVLYGLAHCLGRQREWQYSSRNVVSITIAEVAKTSDKLTRRACSFSTRLRIFDERKQRVSCDANSFSFRRTVCRQAFRDSVEAPETLSYSSRNPSRLGLIMSSRSICLHYSLVTLRCDLAVLRAIIVSCRKYIRTCYCIILVILCNFNNSICASIDKILYISRSRKILHEDIVRVATMRVTRSEGNFGEDT